MMEHLKGRPVALVRAPSGIGGELFFQKHAERYQMPGIVQLDRALDPGHPPLLEVATAEGLLSAAQMNVVEFHTWNAVKSRHRQARSHDLRPRPRRRRGLARRCRKRHNWCTASCEELKLAAFLKTSGGKGLHVVVPLRAQVRLGHRQGLFAGDRAAPRAHAAPALRRQERRHQPRRPHLHRLPAQRLRRHHRGRLVGPIAAGAGHFRSGALGRARGSDRRRALDGRARRTPGWIRATRPGRNTRRAAMGWRPR